MGTPLYPKSIGTEWMKLKTDVKNAFTAANSRIPYQKIGAGILKVFDTLEMQAGSLIRFVWHTGITGLLVGRHIAGTDDADGIFMRRPDGSTALWIWSRVSDGYGYTGIYDQNGNVVFGDDGGSQQGIARPWIPLPFAQTSEMTNPPVGRRATGTTHNVVYSTIVPMQHSWMHFDGYVHTFVGGATAEIKFENLTTGITMYTSATVTSGYITGDFPIGNYTFGETMQVDVTIRRVGGTGDVGLTLLAVEGRQSP